jgi:hypothetical protein
LQEISSVPRLAKPEHLPLSPEKPGLHKPAPQPAAPSARGMICLEPESQFVLPEESFGAECRYGETKQGRRLPSLLSFDC